MILKEGFGYKAKQMCGSCAKQYCLTLLLLKKFRERWFIGCDLQITCILSIYAHVLNVGRLHMPTSVSKCSHIVFQFEL